MFQEAKKAFQDGQKNRWSENHYYGVDKISYMFGRSLGKIDSSPDMVERNLIQDIKDDFSTFWPRFRNASDWKSGMKIMFSSKIPTLAAIVTYTPIYLCEEERVSSNLHREHESIRSFSDTVMAALSDTFHMMVPIFQLLFVITFFKVISIILSKRP